jgi:hypothetical protein
MPTPRARHTTNVAHQIGGSLGLAVLVAVFAAADAGGALQDGALLAHRIAASLTAGAVLAGLALVIALAVRPRRERAGDPARAPARRRRVSPSPGPPPARGCARAPRAGSASARP